MENPWNAVSQRPVPIHHAHEKNQASLLIHFEQLEELKYYDVVESICVRNRGLRTDMCRRLGKRPERFITYENLDNIVVTKWARIA